MNVYPLLSKSKVGYFYIPDNFMHPSLQQELEKINPNVYGCPAIGGLNNRLYSLPNLLDIEIEFGIDNGEPYYNYMINDKVHNTTADMHNLVKDMLSVKVTDDGKAVLQQTISIIFVTDTKDIEMTLMHPQQNLDKENCVAVIGAFYPYAWLRPINLAWVQEDITKPAKLNLKKGISSITIFFNKPISLEQIEPTDKVLKYMSLSSGSINFHRNIRTIFDYIIKKRPKHLL